MPVETKVTRDVLSADVIFLCQCIRDCAKEGLSTHIIEMRNALSAAVTLGFSDYLRFLRHFGYVKLGDDQVLSLADAGGKLAQEETAADLDQQLSAFFADRLSEGVVRIQTEDEARAEIESIDLSAPADAKERTDISTKWQTSPPPLSSASGEWTRQSLPPLAASKLVTPPVEQTKPTLPPTAMTLPPTAMTLPPGTTPAALTVASPYVPGEVIGRGPLGRVLKARHATLGLDLVLKELIDPGAETGGLFAARVKREVSLQARIRHPAVVQIRDVEAAAMPLRIAGEWCEGGNLRAWLAAARPPPPVILRAFTQLLDGLAAIEAEGVAHGNIKAENVLFDRFGNAKLSDLGLGRVMGAGTDHGVRGDMYALGALLYAALTGIRHGPSAPFPSKVVPTLPTAMNWVIEKMTAEDPAERYADPVQAREAMLAALADSSYGVAGVVPVLTGFTSA